MDPEPETLQRAAYMRHIAGDLPGARLLYDEALLSPARALTNQSLDLPAERVARSLVR